MTTSLESASEAMSGRSVPAPTGPAGCAVAAAAFVRGRATGWQTGRLTADWRW